MPFPDRFVTVDARRVGYVDLSPDAPTGAPPLVLLHGAGMDHAELSWLPVIPVLARGRRLIAPDLPGYGESDGFGRSYDLGDMGAWLLAFLDALDLATVDVAGVSMGGGMALLLAADQPARVRRLIPVATYGIMDRAPLHPLVRLSTRMPGRSFLYDFAGRHPWAIRAGLGTAYADRGRIDAATVAAVAAVARDQASRRSFENFLRGETATGKLAGSLLGRLGSVAAPTLLVHGTRDPIVPIRHARAALRHLPDARLLELRAAHWPQREHADTFSTAATAFLDGATPVWPAGARRA